MAKTKAVLKRVVVCRFRLRSLDGQCKMQLENSLQLSKNIVKINCINLNEENLSDNTLAFK